MNNRGENRRLAAILVADVVGYSRLMGCDESGTLDAMNRHRRELIEPALSANRGRLVKTTGDGMLVSFDSAVDATRFAIRLQQGMAARNADVEEQRRMLYRIGINVGDIIVQRRDIFGDGVNIAARLEGLAEAGGICISRGTYEQVRNTLRAAFEDLGPHSFKNMGRPVEVFALPASSIASLPPAVDVRQESSLGSFLTNRKQMAAIALATLVIGASVAAVSLYRRPPPELRLELQSSLAKILPDVNEKVRLKTIEQFLSAAPHRSMVIAPHTKSRWVSGDWPTRVDAEERGLERCQIAFAEPCALLALDQDSLVPPNDGALPTRDMPRARYAGVFDPASIPGLRPSLSKRQDVAGYAAAEGFKAAAYNVRGLLFVVSGAASEAEAETKALKLCNDERSRKDVEGGCFLYASGNRVILTQRRSAPSPPF